MAGRAPAITSMSRAAGWKKEREKFLPFKRDFLEIPHITLPLYLIGSRLVPWPLVAAREFGENVVYYWA